MHSSDILESEGKDLSFDVKTSKCMFWSPQTMRRLNQNNKRADPEGFEVLGAPSGTETHHAKVLSKRVEKTAPLLDHLQQLADPHAAYGIIKICIGTPKMLYTQRTVKSSPSVTEVLLHFDNAQNDCFETIIKGNVTCSNWTPANLPIKFGGLGLRCSSDQHLAAFISSVESVLSTVVIALIGMKPTLENEVNANCLVGLQDVDRRKFRKSLIKGHSNVREIARLQSLLAPNAGAWLTTPISRWACTWQRKSSKFASNIGSVSLYMMLPEIVPS